MAGEIPQAPGVEKAQRPNRLRMPDVKGAISRQAEAARSKIATWLGKNKQEVPHQDPALILTEIATQKSEADLPASVDVKTSEETNDLAGTVSQATPTKETNGLSKQEVRQFSRSTEEGKKARTETAETILKERAIRTANSERLTSEQKLTQQNAEMLKSEKEQLEAQSLAIKAELSYRSTSWVAQARAFMSKEYGQGGVQMQVQLPELDRKIDIKGLQSGEAQKELARLEMQFQKMTEVYQAQPAGQETLQDFYNRQEELLKRHSEKVAFEQQVETDAVELEKYKQEHGTIAEIAKRHDSYIVHGITPGFGGANNPILEEGADWKDKLMVVVAEKPPLSGSFVKEGNGPQDLWSPIGVILKEGVIAEAGGGDLGSNVTDIKTKQGRLTYGNIERYEDGIKRAVATNNISGSGVVSYNELITEFGAKAGAFYINLDQGKGQIYDRQGIVFKQPMVQHGQLGEWVKALHRIDFADMYDTANFVGLPVMVMKDGVLHESTYTDSEGLSIGKKISAQEVTKLSDREIPAENKAKIQQRASSVLKTLAIAA